MCRNRLRQKEDYSSPFFPSTTRLDSEPGILFVRDPLQTPNFIDIKIANNRHILPTRALTVSPHTKEIIEKRYVH